MTTKSEPGFTPGPWELMNNFDIYGPLGGDSGGGVSADHSDGWQVAEVGIYESFVDGQLVELSGAVRKKNIALLLAAPELYAAVENLIAAITPLHNAHFQIERECISDSDVEDAQAAVRDAELVLAKARGEHHEK